MKLLCVKENLKNYKNIQLREEVCSQTVSATSEILKVKQRYSMPHPVS